MTTQLDSTTVESIAVESIAIEGISEPAIAQYFATLNAGEFQKTANLFASEGALLPPFEDAVVGPEAIAQYLEAEARGMMLYPIKGTATPLENGSTEFNVGGKVQTSLFGVHVAWYFVLNADSQILSARIKLLGSLEELLKLKR